MATLDPSSRAGVLVILAFVGCQYDFDRFGARGPAEAASGGLSGSTGAVGFGARNSDTGGVENIAGSGSAGAARDAAAGQHEGGSNEEGGSLGSDGGQGRGGSPEDFGGGGTGGGAPSGTGGLGRGGAGPNEGGRGAASGAGGTLRGGGGQNEAGRGGVTGGTGAGSGGGGGTGGDLDCGKVMGVLAGGHCYFPIASGTGLSWTAARDACAVQRAHLVTITSAEEQALLETAFFPTTVRYWVGLSLQTLDTSLLRFCQRQSGLCEFVWVDGQALRYQHWARTGANPEPNYSGACVRFVSQDATWADSDCDDTLPAICERDG